MQKPVWLVLVGWAAVTTVMAASQTPVPPAPTGAISGVVIDGATKAPLADAFVYLAIQGRGTVGSQSRQLTDAKGRFAFVNLPPNPKYTLSVTRFGYLDGGFRNDPTPGSTTSYVELADGEWVNDVRIALWRPAAIGGRVVDERGEPVVGVYVRVLAHLRIHGRDELASGPITTTDDRGMYRIAGLFPGRYVVQVPSVQATIPAGVTAVASVGRRPGPGLGGGGGGGGAPGSSGPSTIPALDDDRGARLTLGKYPLPPAPVDGRPMAYPISFHPAAASLAQAADVELGFGEDRSGIDVRLEPVPASRVTGMVDGPPEALVALTVRLLPAGLENLGSGSETATALVGADGRFTFLNVPAGAYTIDAPRAMVEFSTLGLGSMTVNLPGPPSPSGGSSGQSQAVEGAPPGTQVVSREYRGGAGEFWGRSTVVVSGTGDTNVVLRMRPIGTMSGTVVVASDPARPPARVPTFWSLQLEPANGNLAASLPRGSVPPNATTNEFSISGLMGGEYFLRLGGSSDFVIKSILWRGRDYLDAPFETSSVADLSNVTVTVTDAAAAVSGVVRDAQGAPAAGATIVAFPTTPAAWINYGLRPPRLRSVVSSTGGRYRLGPLPAGEYHVAAVDLPANGVWQDAEFLKAAARVAPRVTLSWGQTTTQDLAVVTIR
jgi:hypothetical protein